MGYALLAGLPPVYGLYTSIFPGWLYYVFGTSRHLSIGTMALTSLLVGGVISKIPALSTTASAYNRTGITYTEAMTTVTTSLVDVDNNQTYFYDDVYGSDSDNATTRSRAGRLDDPAVAFKVSKVCVRVQNVCCNSCELYVQLMEY